MSWETVIGLEIHVQLATNSKIFSGAATAYGAAPNTQACAIDLGLPGVLPVLNREVVRMAALFGLAVDATVAENCVFARKNYFYPDLPKGYQISQYELPIVHNGRLRIEREDGSEKVIGITRAHLEEDAGKSLHEDFHGQSGIDLNRAGTPLLEIVSEPELSSAFEAVAYMRKIHTLVRYLGISDGNMQEGSFRCDANVSVRRAGDPTLGTRAEIKNLNSFRFVERAINYEVERPIDILESGGKVVQETRLYDTDRDETRSMRSKEEANDYRYFPDPDLLPVQVDAAYLAQLKAQLPELPDAKKQRFMDQFGLSAYDADLLTAGRDVADYFETVVQALDPAQAKLAANWVNGELAAALNRHELAISASRVSPLQLAGLLRRITDGTISGKIGKDVFEALWNGEGTTGPDGDETLAADRIIEQRGLRQISDSSAIEQAIDDIIAANPQQLEQFRAGKDKVLGFFVGQVMKAFKGKANPQQVNELLRRKLTDN
ncbi:MAG: Asp-tRNA(Asn)/Glu-tRNA(Gln) amidotransferase subunit GatB [Gammaproteobacteria bacterium]